MKKENLKQELQNLKEEIKEKLPRFITEEYIDNAVLSMWYRSKIEKQEVSEVIEENINWNKIPMTKVDIIEIDNPVSKLDFLTDMLFENAVQFLQSHIRNWWSIKLEEEIQKLTEKII